MKIRKILIDSIPAFLVGAVILYVAVTREQTVLKTLPTLITLVVQMLLVAANRYAFLLGGTNALLYGIAYFSEGLYFSMISAVAISAPIQYFSFIRWGRRRKEKGTAELRFLSVKGKMLTLLCASVLFVLCYFLLAPFFKDGRYPFLDTVGFALGIVVSVLAAFGYVESQYINLVAILLKIGMWILITLESPENFNYIIISLYNGYRVAQAAVQWTRKYLKNRKEMLRNGDTSDSRDPADSREPAQQ